MANDQTRVKLMGLWWNQTKNGQDYLRGRVGGATVFIFENNYKEKDTDPDMVVFLAPSTKKEDGDQRQDREPPRQSTMREPPPAGDDDIPF